MNIVKRTWLSHRNAYGDSASLIDTYNCKCTQSHRQPKRLTPNPVAWGLHV